jgi:hypothetical protein
MRDDDDIWFDSLAGLRADEPDKAASAARAVRAAILSRRAAEQAPVQGRDASREAQLIERARAEGLLPANRTRTVRRWPAFLAAAAIAAVGVGVALHMRGTSPAFVTRGAASAIVRIRDRNPKQLQQELIRELEEAGVSARGYESFGRPGIDADLPSPLPAGVREILGRHGIAPPADDVLRLEIERAAP